MSFVDWFMAFFCIASHIVIALPHRAKTIAIVIVGRAMTLEREQSKKKQRTDTKKDAKRIKSDNFIRSNREKIGWQHNYFVFWW